MVDATPVTLVLENLGVPYRVFQHPEPVKSLEQAAKERNQHPNQVVRSLLFRVSKGEYLMVLVGGPEQISWRTLRQHVGQSRLTLADREEVLEVTGYEIGSVSPFGLPTPIPVLVDRSVVEEDEISIGSGVRGTTVIIKTEDLIQALGNVEIVNLRE